MRVYRMDERDIRRTPVGNRKGNARGRNWPWRVTMPQQLHVERELRTASVTIRLSTAECARLHQRAAEAGLTVSAYLRSCMLEAELYAHR